jgi:hypothetical protein
VGSSGVPEVSSGIPSPPSSPPLSAAARREAASYTIAGECERLFCGTLRSVFLGEGNRTGKDPLALGVSMSKDANDYGSGYPFPEPESVSDWIEMWDYVGGIRFRGFVAEKEDERAMFVFFDQAVVAGDLKAGYVTSLSHSRAHGS